MLELLMMLSSANCDEARRREVFRSLRHHAGLRPLAPHLAALASREAAEAHKTSRPCEH